MKRLDVNVRLPPRGITWTHLQAPSLPLLMRLVIYPTVDSISSAGGKTTINNCLAKPMIILIRRELEIISCVLESVSFDP